jgi:hypothetical protein
LEYAQQLQPNPLTPPQQQQSSGGSAQVRLPVAVVTMEFEFNSDESEAAIAERFVQKKSALLLDRIEERVVLKLVAVDALPIACTTVQSS